MREGAESTSSLTVGLPPRAANTPYQIENRSKSNHATWGRRHSTARVSKRLTNETAACLRARYCADLAWLDLAYRLRLSDHGWRRPEEKPALIIVSATGQKLRGLEKNLCELCAFAPLRETRPSGRVSRKGAKAQSSQRLLRESQILHYGRNDDQRRKSYRRK